MYFLLLFLCWCDTSCWHVIQWRTFYHGKQKSPKKKVLHLTCWALHIDHTVHGNASAEIFFPESLVRGVLTRFITRELTFSFHFSMAIWNDWKCVVLPGSNAKEQELNQMLQLVSWFKTQMPTGCGTTNTTETKRHTHSQFLAHFIPKCTHEIENIFVFVFLGKSTVI